MRKEIWYTWNGKGEHPTKAVAVMYRDGFIPPRRSNNQVLYDFNRDPILWEHIDNSDSDVVAYTLGERR